MTRLLSVAAFEFRYQARSLGFWLTTAAFGLFAGLMMGVPDLQSNMGDNVYRNSPMAITLVTFSFSLFYMFAATAFVANSVVRDDETGFAPIVRATPLGRFDYLIGRFAGAFAVAALGFLIVPVAMALAAAGPWLDPKTMGPFRLDHYLYAYGVIALPTLFVGASILFVLASVTRSMLGSYVGLAALFGGYFASQALPSLDYETLRALLDPFGLRAFLSNVKYWTSAEANTQMAPLTGLLLANRALWVGISVAFLVAGVLLFRFDRVGMWMRRRQAAESAAEALAPVGVERPAVSTWTGARAWARQFLMRVWFEFGQVATSPAFLVILIIGTGLAISGLWTADETFGTRTFPVTRLMIDQLEGAFAAVPAIVALFWAGELVWRERSRRMNEIIAATSTPDEVFVASKATALWLVLMVLCVIGALTAMGVQAAKGYATFEAGKYLAWWVLPQTVDFGIFAAAALFFQAVAPNRFAGWGLLLLYVAADGIFSTLVIDHNMLSMGSFPAYGHSDMNGAGDFAGIAAWYRAYWAAFSLFLLAIVSLIWRRGAPGSIFPGFVALPRRLKGPTGALAAASLAVFVGLGAWIFVNTTVWNPFQTRRQAERYAVRLEKDLLAFEKLPQPSVVDVKLDLHLDPHAPRLDATGVYTLENRTGAPLGAVHLRFPRRLRVKAVGVDGLKSSRRYRSYNYYVLNLARPMAPGERRTLRFETLLHQRGFRDEGNLSRIADNGTFLSHDQFSPTIGMTRAGLLGDKAKRRKHGLPEELRPAKLEDVSATARNDLGADWVHADITVTTVADQVPIAPGYKVSETVAGGRRTARFVTEAPILHFFSVQSARYAVERRAHKGVELTIYHHPDHEWNVSRMLTALTVGLDYYQESFGPYQFRQVRILEFPYGSFAQAFAGTIPYSEQIGFIADVTDEEKIDYITFVTAHELGHQWWGHQLTGADVQGAAVLSETLAEYSALMVMERLYGPDKIRRFLRYELDTYLSARAGGNIEELPLYRAENQQHIFYQKGGMVMYLLRDQIGEEAVNRALRRFLEQHRFKAAPYPRSTDLVAALRAEAGPEHQQLITDLFERITLYDTRVKTAKVTKRADGRHDVSVTIAARKLYAGGDGKETEAPLAEVFDIGLFTAAPGAGAFDASKVILVERKDLRGGDQTFTFTVDRAPTHVGVDPYVKRIERNSHDNILAIGGRQKSDGAIRIEVEKGR